jgi:uncharacterized protein YybS (DUF2232 family)
MNKGQAVLATLIAIGVTLACLLGVTWLGVAGAFLNLLTPSAAAYVGMRYRLQNSLVVVIVTSLLLFQLTTAYALLAYLSMFGIASVLLPYWLKKPLFWDRSVFQTTAVSLAAVVLILVGTMTFSHTGLSPILDQIVQTEVDQAMEIYQTAGLDESQLQQVEQVIAEMATFVIEHIVGLFVVATMGVQFFCLWLLQLCRRNDYRIYGTSYALWKLPSGLIWVLIVAGFSSFVPVDTFRLIGGNLLVIVLPLYFLQGFAVMTSFMRLKKYPAVLKGLIYALMLIFNPLQIVITGVGIFDLWVDFRRPRTKN